MRVRVVTYNIHRAIGLDRRFRPDRIVTLLAHHEPDVVLLQEVDEGAPRSRELDLAKELALALELPYYAVGHNVSLRKGRYGNATLSRHAIDRERNIDLTIGNRKRRGCQHTTITVRGRTGKSHRMEVFNLHLGLSARERIRQAGVLSRSHEFVSLPSDVACLVGGDFNDWRSQLRVLFDEALGFRCATDRPTRRGPVGIKTYPALSPQGSLDKLYCRGPIRILSAFRSRHRYSRIASDHLPLVAEFELT